MVMMDESHHHSERINYVQT